MILPDRVVQRDLGAWPVSGFAVSCDTIALRNPVSHLYASRVPPVQESDRGLRILSMYWQWSPGLAPDRSYLYSQVAESTRQCILPVTSRHLCPPLYHYTIYIVIVNRYSLIIIYIRKSISINDLHVSGLPRTITPFGDQVGEMLWMGRSYFITSKFSGYDMSWSLLLTTISRLYGTCPSS